MINNDKTLIYFVQSLSRPAVKPALPLKSSSEVLEASHDPLLYEDAVMLTLGEREREPMGEGGRRERESVCGQRTGPHTLVHHTRGTRWRLPVAVIFAIEHAVPCWIFGFGKALKCTKTVVVLHTLYFTQ